MEIPPPPAEALAAAHGRFAREALLIQAGAGLLALALLVAGLLADLRADEADELAQLQLETVLRARMLDARLSALIEEIDRLALRAEVDPGDADALPERVLLDASHGESTVFDLGVAVLDRSGRVLASEPSDPGEADVPAWLSALGALPEVDTTDVRPLRSGTHGLALVRSLVRDGERVGTLVAATLLPDEIAFVARHGLVWHLVDDHGERILPAPSSEPTDGRSDTDEAIVTARLPDRALTLLGEGAEDTLYADARARFRNRLAIGLIVLGLPLALLVARFARTLSVFRTAQAAAVEDAQLRTMGSAANAIAHEVRNALNGIRMGIDLLDQVGEQRRARVQAELRHELARLVDFTATLMQFARSPDLVRGPVDLVEITRSVVGFHAELAAELGVRIDLEGEATAPVQGDRTLLRMAVENLVRNALDALSTRPGGRVVVSIGRRDGRWVVRVDDDGPGVSQAVGSRMFEPFVTGRPSGVGLGLSLVRQVVTGHHGTVRHEGRGPLGGASFVIELPAEGG